jgi:hypothetical protein
MRVWALRGLAVALAGLVSAGAVHLIRRYTAPTTGQLEITTSPGATIVVEGKVAGVATGGRLRVEAVALDRTHRVVGRLEGYEPKHVVVSPRAGTTPVAIVLDRVATVDVDTRPSDARVEIDGRSVGTTPLSLTSLAPGTMVAITFSRPGYRTSRKTLKVPARGERARLVDELELSPDAVRVHFVSTPPGAAIVRDGEPPSPGRTYTPADVYVEAGKLQRFRLIMPKHAPLVIEPFTPAHGSPPLEKGGVLAAQ